MFWKGSYFLCTLGPRLFPPCPLPTPTIIMFIFRATQREKIGLVEEQHWKNQYQRTQISPWLERKPKDILTAQSHSPCPRPFSLPKTILTAQTVRAPRAEYASGSRTHFYLGKILVTWGELGQEQGNSQNQKEFHNDGSSVGIGGF